jgi:hypothetical protein
MLKLWSYVTDITDESFFLYLFRYFVRKMSVADPEAMLSAYSAKYLQALREVTQSVCSTA